MIWLFLIGFANLFLIIYCLSVGAWRDSLHRTGVKKMKNPKNFYKKNKYKLIICYIMSLVFMYVFKHFINKI